jgi:hypothetical protein
MDDVLWQAEPDTGVDGPMRLNYQWIMLGQEPCTVRVVGVTEAGGDGDVGSR